MRGLSILLVLSFHYFNLPRQGGALGVGLFFCISGYLITSILLDEVVSRGRLDWKRFYIRRARRLLPLAYLVLGLTSITFLTLDLLGYLNVDKRGLLLSTLFATFYVGNLFGFFHLGYANLAVPIGHFWSLAVEEQFYLIWPGLLVSLVKKVRRASGSTVLLFLISLSTVLHVIFQLAGKTVWTLPTTYLDILFAGCWIAFMQFEREFTISKRWSMALLATSLLLATYVFFSKLEPTDFLGLGYSVIAAVEYTFFLALLGSTGFGEMKPLTWIGDMSYSLYCIHFPILILFNYLFGSSVLRIPSAFAVALALSILSRQRFEVLFWRSRFVPQMEIEDTLVKLGDDLPV